MGDPDTGSNIVTDTDQLIIIVVHYTVSQTVLGLLLGRAVHLGKVVNNFKVIVLLFFLSFLVTDGLIPGKTIKVLNELAPLIKLGLQVITLHLALVHEVTDECHSVVFADSLHFVQALICKEAELFAHLLHALGV